MRTLNCIFATGNKKKHYEYSYINESVLEAV